MNAEPADKTPETAAKTAAAVARSAGPVSKTANAAAKPTTVKKASASARAPANRDGKRKPGGTRRARPADRKPGGRQQADDATSKAGLIRKVASIIKAKGAKPRPSEIVKILGEEGVKVSAAQVSQTLKAAGYRPLRQRRGTRKPAAGPGKAGSGSGANHHISLDDLLAAKSVSGAFGGTDKAIAALEALKRLER